MLLKRLAILMLLTSVPAWATFGAKTAWDVQTTGANTNGGGFDAGVVSPGTDESMGVGTAITVTLTGTTTGTGSPVFSATTHGPGNFVHIASGTGCTVGWFEVLSQSSGTATFDHAMGAAANVCVGTIGGSLLTPAQAAANLVATNTVYVQQGTYTFTTPLSVALASAWVGYTAIHGDLDGAIGSANRPLFTTATDSVNLLNANSASGTGFFLSNFRFTNTASTKALGIYSSSHSGSLFIQNCYFSGFGGTPDGGAAIANTNATNFDWLELNIENSEFVNNVIGVNTTSSNISRDSIKGTYFHGNVQDVVSGQAGRTVTLTSDIFAGATSASLPALSLASLTNARNLTVYGSAFTALSISGNEVCLSNSVFYGNYRAIAGTTSLSPLCSNTNAFGGNTNANTSWTASSSDLTLTANPWVAAGTGNFALNSTSGGGAALTSAAWPSAFGTTTRNYQSIGAAQPNPAGGGGGTTATNTGWAQ